MVNYKNKYLEMKLKYINAKYKLSGGANPQSAKTIMEIQKDIVVEDAGKWLKLVEWLKNIEDDDDIWDFLGDELGVEPDGEENSEKKKGLQILLTNLVLSPNPTNFVVTNVDAINWRNLIKWIKDTKNNDDVNIKDYLIEYIN